jgi:RNA polymerase sigma factor (sigma-70 family)
MRVPEASDVLLAKAGDQQATRRVVEDMAQIIAMYANRFGRIFKGDVDDLRQIGAMAVFHAISRFDPERGRAFSWYATQWIRSRMGYVLARERHRPEVSMELPIGEDQTLGDVLPALGPCTDELVIRSEEVRRLRLALARIEIPEHREIMLQRAAGSDYAAIGRSVGYSREYVRQIVNLYMKVLSETLEREAA